MTPPQTLLAGRYRLLEPIGQGGMGRVWLAMDEFLKRQVAVKEVVAPQGLTAAEVRDMGARALREARAAARLSHPNVVIVYDIVVTDTAPWIVMEYLQCRSLYEVVTEDGPLPVGEAARVGLAVLGALRAAHAVGVLHRDVKPSNVLIDKTGRIVLTDFGLATIVGDPSVTRSGLIIGSPSYMAPERVRDAEAGEAADLWSLGATLYFSVESRSPYERTTALATVAALAAEDPDPAVRAGRLKPVLNGLLRRDPAARLDAATLERMLRAVHRASLKQLAPAPLTGKPFAAAVPVANPVEAVAATGSPPPGNLPLDKADKPDGANKAGTGWPGKAETGKAPAGVGTGKADEAGTGSPAKPAARTELLWTKVDEARAMGPQVRRWWVRAKADRRTWAIGIVAGLLVLAAATWALANPSGSPPAADKTSAAATASAGPSATSLAATGDPAPTGTPVPTGAPLATGEQGPLALPPGWHMYTDPTGFKVAVDASWQVSRQGTIVYFREGRGGRTLGIDQTDKPIADPVADWTGKEDYRVKRGDFPSYHRVRLVEVDYFDKAADWEFTYLLDGAPVHVNNRGFIVSPTKAYGMWWSTPASRWDEYRPQLDLIQRSFVPAE